VLKSIAINGRTPMNIRVAILQNKNHFNHSTLWNSEWSKYCKDEGIPYDIIHPYDTDIIQKLKNVDIMLWHFTNYNIQDMTFARSIIYSAKQLGVEVFPDFQDSWHFDDKIAESYLLQSIGAPVAQAYIFYDVIDIENWLASGIKFPIVAKLKSGSGAHNVRLLNNSKQVLAYSKRMLRRGGFKSYPSTIGKATANIRSLDSYGQFVQRFKRIPEFLRTLHDAKQFPNEKGYVYFQEFVQNDGFDLKVVVVGDKLSAFKRLVRKNDFRASGGGTVSSGKVDLSLDIIQSAFKTSERLGFKCMGYDYVVDKETGKGKIIEMSYGFLHSATVNVGGYYDVRGDWFGSSLNPPRELLKNIINQMIT
jgi:glutathione synthase/RimK-type ligase-like ATP-grasp enzyme